MSTTPNGSSVSEVQDTDASKEPEQIEADIARHRQELGRTVDELTERLDLNKQARRKVASTKAQAKDQLENVKARAQSAEVHQVAAAVAPALGVVALVLLFGGFVRRGRR